jgi:hypothetical protein
MSIVIPRHILNGVQMEKIQRELFVHKERKFFGKKFNNFAQKNNFEQPLQFYINHGEYIRLPYHFAVQLLGYNPQCQVWQQYRIFPVTFKGELRPYQREICRKAGQHLEETSTAILNIFASGGKTIMATYLACKTKHCRLILCPDVGICKQWAATIKNFSSANYWIVGEEEQSFFVPDFILCSINRVDKVPLDLISMVGFLILDEMHKYYTQIRINEILKFSPKYILVCTATLGKKREIAHLLAGDRYIFKKSTKPFNVFKYYTGITFEEDKNKMGGLDWAKYVAKQTESFVRNDQIFDIVTSHSQFKILILTWREEHALFLGEMFSKHGESVDTMTGMKKEYNDSRILIGTVSKLGTGFDEANVCKDYGGRRIDLLIMVGTMKDEDLLEQVAGRCFRSDFPNIVYMVDNNEIAHSHWNVANDWFKSRNGTITEVFSSYAHQPQIRSSLLPLKKRREKSYNIGEGDDSMVMYWDKKRIIGPKMKSKEEYISDKKKLLMGEFTSKDAEEVKKTYQLEGSKQQYSEAELRAMQLALGDLDF